LKKHEEWKKKGECVKQYKINANGGGICKGYNFFSGGGRRMVFDLKNIPLTAILWVSTFTSRRKYGVHRYKYEASNLSKGRNSFKKGWIDCF
jgi:hypothetical protein